VVRDEAEGALEGYFKDWQRWVKSNRIAARGIRPTTIGWRVDDRDAFNAEVAALRDSPGSYIRSTHEQGVGAFVLDTPIRRLSVVHLVHGPDSQSTGLEYVGFTVADRSAFNKNLEQRGVTYASKVDGRYGWTQVEFGRRACQARIAAITITDAYDLGLIESQPDGGEK